MGNDLRMFNPKDNNGGVYRDGSLIYAFPTGYSSGNFLRTWSNPYEDWVGLFTAGDDLPSLTVTHNNSGAASIRLGLRGGVISMTSGYPSAYSSWIDDGYYINLSESRSLIINYNANGGSGAPSNTYFYGSTENIVLSSTIPTRPGYTFLGWSASGAATTATYSAGQNIGTRTSSLALFAVWRINSYTVTCEDRVGSASGTLLGTKTASYTYGSSVSGASFGSDTSYDAYYTGYHYTGSSSTITVDGNETVYRYFALNTWTVSYNANGGSGAPSSQTKTYGVNLTLSSTVPTRTGYSFLGWSTSSTATSATYSAGGTYSANAGAILYAVWRLNTYSLSAFQTNSSVFVNRTSSPLGGGTIGTLGNGATLYYNDSLTITFAANTGYTLTVHTVNGNNFSSGSSHTVVGAVTVVSTAAANTYSVVFNANRGAGTGSGTMANQSFTYDQAKALTANAYTRQILVTFNYTGGTGTPASSPAVSVFNGWARSADGAAVFTDGQSVSNLTTSQNGTVNLYAKWANGNVTLPTPTRTGYTFKGWYSAESGGTKIGNGGDTYTPTAPITIFAQWTLLTFTLDLTASDNGLAVNVLRSASPIGGGDSGLLSDGATLYYNDVVTVTYAVSQGYQLEVATVNGEDISVEGRKTVTVTGNLVVVITVDLGAIVYIGNEAYQAFIGNGTNYAQYEAFFGNGSGYDPY